MNRLFASVLAVLTLFILVPGDARAAGTGSWWVALDAWMAEPSNLNLDVALQEDPSIATGGEVIGLDFGAEFSGKIRLGWSPVDPTRHGYSVSYWSWDNDESLSQGGGIMPAVTDPFFANISSQSVASTADISVSILDIAITRRLAVTKRSAWHWGAGFRHASFDESWEIEYYDPSTGISGPIETVDIDMDASGSGITAGLGGVFRWNGWIRSAVRTQFSLLKGETEASYRDRGYIDDLLLGLQGFFTTGIERAGEDRVFQQIELEAKVIFRLWEGLEAALGYSFMNWADVVQVDRLLDDVQGGLSFAREDLAFDGVTLSVSYTWE